MTTSLNLDISQTLAKQLEQLRLSYQAEPAPSYESRCQHLQALKSALLGHQNELISALSQDYGHRSVHDSLIADIMPCINNLNYTLKQLKSWMRPSRRHSGLLLAPASVQVHYQPLGVVGIIVPWNFPIMLAIGPLITAIAAGNRAMLKLSEHTPATNKVLSAMLGSIYPDNQVLCIEGEADVAAAFSSLPFDHLLFTGSTAVAHHVMHSAADNLTPVTLELGGKSPVLIGEDINIKTAVARMIYGKCLNAGQICVSPDYVLVPKNKIDSFIKAYQRRFSKMYGKQQLNADYSSVINQAQFTRLTHALEDAKTKGAQVISANGAAIDHVERKMPTQLVINVRDDMIVMQQEIFGPILPVIGYDNIEEAIEFINQRPRPLALYLMSFDKTLQQQVINQTHSGGVCINETLLQVAADDAPFGGIGPSGMGHYHGKEGFLTFSHAKTVFRRGRFNAGKIIQPPYGKALQKKLLSLFLR